MPAFVDPEERREQVAAVVADIIADRGLDAVTVRAVAKAAGFSTAVVSHYFSGKRDLLLYSFRMAQTRAYARLEKAISMNADAPEKALDTLLPFHAEARRDWLVWSTFWTVAIADPEFSALQREQFRLARRRFEYLLRISKLTDRRASRAQIQAQARSLLTTLIGLAIQAAFDPEDWPEEQQRQLLRDALQTHMEAGS